MMVYVIILAIIIAVLLLIHFFVIEKAFRGGGNNDGVEHVVLGSGSGGSRESNAELSEGLKKFPCFDYKAAETEGATTSPEDCVVCLDNFKFGDACRLLPNCNHSFHTECIELWVLKTPFCPICRTSVFPLKIGVNPSEENEASVGVVVEA